MEGLIHDLSFATRSLRRHPGFSAIVVATIALGIGFNIAVFSVVHAVLLRPLPYRDAGQVVSIFTQMNTRPRFAVAPRDVVDFRERTTLFEEFGGTYFSAGGMTLTGGDEPIHVYAAQVTTNLFSLLGLEPAVGRGFLPEDAVGFGRRTESDTLPPSLTGVIVSHGLWQRYFGADPGVIGQTIEINKRLARIVGVMPEGFRVFPSSEAVSAPQVDLWYPFWFDFREDTARRQILGAFARLKPGVTVEQAQAEMDVITSQLQEELPTYRSQNIRFRVVLAQDDVVKAVRPTLLVLLGAVGFLLLLSCANVANLLLVRARTRLDEMAIRGALGCARSRLARQALIECLVLAGAGGLAGLTLAWLGIRLLLILQPANVPRLEVVSINGPVLVFSLSVTVLAAVLFGVLPAIQAGRINLVEGLKDQARGSIGGRKGRLLGSLVVVEVALSMLLLVGAGVMMRTFIALGAIQPGFEPRGALTFPIDLYDWEKYSGREAVIGVIRELEERIRALPGVEDVGTTNVVPFTSGGGSTPYAWDEASEAHWNTWAIVRVVTGDYFRTMRTRFLAGRPFSGVELMEPTASVIVDETLAREAWPNEDPIGKFLTYGPGRERVEVVGVVEHANLRWLREDARGTIYRPFATLTRGSMKVVVRGSGDLGSLVTPIRNEIRALDPGLAIQSVKSLEDILDDVLAPTRFALVLMSIFASLALILAAVGMYGVISYSVGQRTAEIGIRTAFGADRKRILRLVVGRGAALIAIGVVVGVAAILALSRFAASVVYGVSTLDPATLIAVALVLSAVGLLASYVPARRATVVDPVAALRRG